MKTTRRTVLTGLAATSMVPTLATGAPAGIHEAIEAHETAYVRLDDAADVLEKAENHWQNVRGPDPLVPTTVPERISKAEMRRLFSLTDTPLIGQDRWISPAGKDLRPTRPPLLFFDISGGN